MYTKIVSSYAWDTTLCFIQKTISDYATNSTQGNYGSSLMNTGLTTPVCNIYDMAGNIEEFTSESCSAGKPHISRGSSYGGYATGYPAGGRYSNYNDSKGSFGFRVTLYLK